MKTFGNNPVEIDIIYCFSAWVSYLYIYYSRFLTPTIYPCLEFCEGTIHAWFVAQMARPRTNKSPQTLSEVRMIEIVLKPNLIVDRYQKF